MATLGHPAAFRIAIAMAGAPRTTRGIVPDPRALRYEEHHLTLREARFKFHALPGGETALFDLAADPTETREVQKAFAEVAQRLAVQCRQRWTEITTSGRAFRMPAIVVDAQAGRGRGNVIPAAAAQTLGGRTRVLGQMAEGFAVAGDSVTYRLEVRTAGRYRITVRGQGLAACAPLRIELGAMQLAPASSAPTAIDFGVTTLAAGPATLTLGALAAPSGARAATIRDIALTPVPAR